MPDGAVANCARCNFQLTRRRPNSRTRTITFSLAALILYFPSNYYPIITAEYHGQHSETTVFQGIRALFTHGQFFIGTLVFCTSLLTPAIKIVLLLFIPLTLDWPRWKRARTWAYRIIRIVDPWNMLEVFLLAIVVSMAELGRIATVHPGPGVFSFAAVVTLTLLATLSFDPRLLWDSPEEQKNMSRVSDEKNMPAALPRAQIRKNRFAWLYWLVPAGAVLLCAWFIYRDLISGGPTIAMFFKNADGVEEKNTQIKFRGANVGEVRSLEITKDHQLVKITARLTPSARSLASEGSVFWIVRPEVRVGTVTGLGTIVSGEYIGVQPGTGPPTNMFIGADKEPLEEDPDALQITLHSSTLSSLQELSPIFYRGIQVGEVLYFQLGDDSRGVVVHARIRRDYAPLVRLDTKFWNAGGVDLRFGLFKGVRISAESPKTVLSGGIEFATPSDSEVPARDGATFQLYEKPEDAWKIWDPYIKLNPPRKATQTNLPSGLNLK